MRGAGEQATLPEDAADPRGGDVERTPLYLGTLGGRPCLADDFGADAPVPPGCRFVPLRALHGQLGEAEYALAGYALQMLYWRRTSGFCPVCGHATEAAARRLGAALPPLRPCRLPAHQPRRADLGPRRGGRILLGHKPGWGARYSILAGFVEPGESLEDCVRRETQEEAGLAVVDIAYAGSQPWPFPHQLMVGFTAREAGGDLRADAEELDDVRWFTVEALPELPSAVSLSRQMIDAWIAAQSG